MCVFVCVSAMCLWVCRNACVCKSVSLCLYVHVSVLCVFCVDVRVFMYVVVGKCVEIDVCVCFGGV